jgi:hypothetical protein
MTKASDPFNAGSVNDELVFPPLSKQIIYIIHQMGGDLKRKVGRNCFKHTHTQKKRKRKGMDG